MISLATSNITRQVRINVNACLDENRIGQGRFIQEFEDKFASYMKAKYAIAVCNGSMADIISVAALKAMRPEKTEIIVPVLTFIAHPNSILINGLTPVFVDVEWDFQIDTYKIESKITDKTLAIFPVHLLGSACNILKIMDISKKYNLFVIEDCCEALGGEVANKKLGTFGDFGTFSFFPSHTITTGEGGMIITNNDELSLIARSLRNHGRVGENVLNKFHFKYQGFNGKMSNIIASIGSALVDGIDRSISNRKQNVEYLNKNLGLNWYATSPHCYPMNFFQRDIKMKMLEEKGIESRKLFSCVTNEEAYKFLNHQVYEFPNADFISSYYYFIPIHQDLTTEELDYMVSCLQ